MRGDREGLDAVEHHADRSHVLLQRAQDRRRGPQDDDALRGGVRKERRDSGGENEGRTWRSTTVGEPAQNPPDELRRWQPNQKMRISRINKRQTTRIRGRYRYFKTASYPSHCTPLSSRMGRCMYLCFSSICSWSRYHNATVLSLTAHN